jgi:uncharacterized membrane protein (DUF485 family)
MMFFLAPVNLTVVALQGHLFLLTEIFKNSMPVGVHLPFRISKIKATFVGSTVYVLNFIQPFGGCLRGVQEVLKICNHCTK